MGGMNKKNVLLGAELRIKQKPLKKFLELMIIYSSSYLWLNEERLPDDNKAKEFLQNHKGDKILAKGFIEDRTKYFLQQIPSTKKQLKDIEEIRRSLINDSHFHDCILKARKNLRISDNRCANIVHDNVQEALDSLYWELEMRDGVFESETRNTGKLHSLYHIEICLWIVEILEEFCLEYIWENFIIACIASPNVEQTKIEVKRCVTYPLCQVLSVSEDYVSLKIKRGVAKKEFDAIWKGAEDFLKESPAEYREGREISEPGKRMLADIKKGMSIEEVAVKYEIGDSDCEEVRKSSTRKRIYREKKKSS